MSNIKCAGCGVEKPPEAYPKRSGRQTRRGICRACLRSRKRLRALGEGPAESTAAQALYGEQAAAREGEAEREWIEPSVSVNVISEAEAAEEPKRKHKRKRRRGKRAKKKAALAAGLDEADDPQPSTGEELADHTEHELGTDSGNSDAQDHDPALAAESTGDAPAEREQGKRQRKRKRRRRSKKSANVAVSSIKEDTGGDTAKHILTSADEGTEIEQDSAHQHDEEEHPVKRKRKRKRKRRKSKQIAESETAISEIEAPKRPAVRPPNKRIVPFKGPFTFDAAILNDKGTGMIRLRGRRETGKRWHTEIEKDIAVRMVQEGAAGIIHPRLIHKLYTKSDFRLLILQRDNYVCRYCGQFGDTIDHVMPKSKGGLSSPMNCVCACSECNLLKADKLDFPYPDDPDEDAEE
ncbi:HNH endonuclease [Paenibacillus cellulosilyticus]|nr:HNH endonuclease signature motif containing protein [Paenibacillus cellulosilyticus]QKS44319.1 HNH endonuclease [Paenibacillus cellulosilyticus]